MNNLQDELYCRKIFNNINNVNDTNNLDIFFKENWFTKYNFKNNIEFIKLYFKYIFLDLENPFLLKMKEEELKKIFNLFNFYYIPDAIQEINPNLFPYGIYQLNEFISLSNETKFLINNNILCYDKDNNIKLKNLEYKDDDNNVINFIELIRFEKDKNFKFVLQNIENEKHIGDDKFIVKGQYYYPSFGSGVLFNLGKHKYYLNKIHAIIELHKLAKDNKKYLYEYNDIDYKNIIQNFINDNKFGLFGLFKKINNINDNNIEFFLNGNKFDALLEFDIMKYLYE